MTEREEQYQQGAAKSEKQQRAAVWERDRYPEDG